MPHSKERPCYGERAMKIPVIVLALLAAMLVGLLLIFNVMAPS